MKCLIRGEPADRRRMPAHLKRKHRKRSAPKPAVTEKVIAERKAAARPVRPLRHHTARQ